MQSLTFKLVGRGVYTLAEAERLTGVSARRIRRWTRGYTYKYKGEVQYTPPIIRTRVNDDTTPVVTFSDLIEVRFLDAFRRAGVSWKTLHIAAYRAKELLGRHHPFSSRIFRTDGRTILAELLGASGDRVLLDLIRDQYEFERIIAPYLYEGLDYDRLAEPERWWPLGKDRLVVIDPQRNFGAPIVRNEGVQTRILVAGYKAEGSVEFVARWYEVSEEAVRDAIEFEASLAA